MISRKAGLCNDRMGKNSQTSPSRIGFFGGSFDPVHLGHFLLAQKALEISSLDLILFCPAFHAPLRSQKPLFPPELRLKMLNEISKDDERMKICTLELEKQKTCFTYHTLLEIRNIYPNSELFVLLGADQFERLNQWKYHHELAQICKFLVFSRDSFNASPPAISNLSFHLIKNDLIEISSTQIRNRLQDGKSIDEFVPSSIHPIINNFFQS